MDKLHNLTPLGTVALTATLAAIAIVLQRFIPLEILFPGRLLYYILFFEILHGKVGSIRIAVVAFAQIFTGEVLERLLITDATLLDPLFQLYLI
jgi:hypothetical protein